jgi:hypothetical protein
VGNFQFGRRGRRKEQTPKDPWTGRANENIPEQWDESLLRNQDEGKQDDHTLRESEQKETLGDGRNDGAA